MLRVRSDLPSHTTKLSDIHGEGWRDIQNAFDERPNINFAFCEPFQLFDDDSVSKLIENVEAAYDSPWEYSTERTSACVRGYEPLEKLVESVRFALEEKMSRIVGRSMRVHPITFERAHVNVQRAAQTKPVDNWHIDSTPFVLVTVLTNHEDDAGGSLLVQTTKNEGGGQVCAKLKRPGQAMLMQGSHMWHCAEASRTGRRLTMVTSFFCDAPNVYDTTSVRIALLYSPPLSTLTQYIAHVLGRIRRGADALLRTIDNEKEADEAREIATVLCREISKLKGATFEIAGLLARGQKLQVAKRVPDVGVVTVPLASLASAASILGHHLTSFDEAEAGSVSIQWARALRASVVRAMECAESTMGSLGISVWSGCSAL